MGDRSSFDPDGAPDDPFPLFGEWLTGAVDVMPMATVLSTVDEFGRPDARVVMLRGISADGWSFASSALGPKGTQLAATPWGALTWYWPTQGRQIRARGPVRAHDGTADFHARPPGARAEAAIGARQSQPLSSLDELRAALADAATSTVPPGWTTYALHPVEVQFFQIEPDRAHVRLRYDRTDDDWAHTLLWP